MDPPRAPSLPSRWADPSPDDATASANPSGRGPSKTPSRPSRWADPTPSPVEDGTPGAFRRGPPTPAAEATPATSPDAKPTNAVVAPYLLSAPKSTPTSRTSTPNKRAAKWNGRTVVIQIPTDITFGGPGGRPIPLTADEVAARMRSWIDNGYAIEIGGQGACREIYPEEQRGKVEASDIFVSIPDRSGMCA